MNPTASLKIAEHSNHGCPQLVMLSLKSNCHLTYVINVDGHLSVLDVSS